MVLRWLGIIFYCLYVLGIVKDNHIGNLYTGYKERFGWFIIFQWNLSQWAIKWS